MNKLVLSDKENTLVIHDKDLIEVEKDTYITNLVLPNEFTATILLKSNLTIESKTIFENVKGSLLIISEDHSHLVMHLGITARKINNLVIENEVKGSYACSEIKIRVIGEEKSNTTLKTVGHILNHTKEDTFLEEVKYLNEEDSIITCIPLLLVSSNDVVANHNVTVSNISEEELFYLESKGIKKSNARTMLREIFLRIF